MATAREIEVAAQGSLKAATERVAKGVAPITDQLQAQTSHEQAVYSLAKAGGDWKTALGKLAADMDLDPYVAISLPAVGDGVAPTPDFDQTVVELIDEAKRTHPSVLAAQAEFDAADAKIREVRSEGMPSVALVAKTSVNNQAVTPELGGAYYPATGHDAYIGVQVTVPLFEGFGRGYLISQARSQRELQRVAVAAAKQKVGLDVWTSYQKLTVATQNLANSATLLDVAMQSFSAAQHRYASGVGNILELLNAQTSLAGAKKQRIQALTDWRIARLELAGTLGRLGMWSVSLD